MDHIADEPVRFYLRHRAQIHEWAALAKAAQAASRQILADIASRLETEAPPDTLTWHGGAVATGATYRMVLYSRPAWNIHPEPPSLGVGLVWPASVELGDHEPMLGVHLAPARPGRTAVRDALRALDEQTLRSAGFTLANAWEPWPLYRYLDPPAEGFWDDLTAWNDGIVDAVTSTYDRLGPVIDDMVAPDTLAPL